MNSMLNDVCVWIRATSIILGLLVPDRGVDEISVSACGLNLLSRVNFLRIRPVATPNRCIPLYLPRVLFRYLSHSAA